VNLKDLFKRKQQLIKEIELSSEAKAIWESPLVQAFFADAEAAAYRAWQSTPCDAYEARERLYVVDGILRNFKDFFKGHLAQGQFAERALEEIVKQEEMAAKKR
jgi:hypothetical protein